MNGVRGERSLDSRATRWAAKVATGSTWTAGAGGGDWVGVTTTAPGGDVATAAAEGDPD